MTEEIIVALVTGAVTLIGVLASNNKHDAVIDIKIDDLTKEVKKHNNFAERVPLIEQRLEYHEQRINDIEDAIYESK